jgi:hypothetical protein
MERIHCRGEEHDFDALAIPENLIGVLLVHEPVYRQSLSFFPAPNGPFGTAEITAISFQESRRSCCAGRGDLSIFGTVRSMAIPRPVIRGHYRKIV